MADQEQFASQIAHRPAASRAGLTRHQSITDEDVQAVADVLRSDWITQGPMIHAFEERVAAYCGARYAVAFSSGTAALHGAVFAAGIQPGDEVITTPLTFVASANCAVYQGATPIFADIDPRTLTIDPSRVAERIGAKTRAIIPVHFAGLPCDLGALAALAQPRGLVVIEDACHALGAEWRSPEGRWERIGSCSHSDMAVFSFHPVKHITTGEGGMVLTNRQEFARSLRMFRHHGILRAEEISSSTDEPWVYAMEELGFNYRITDFQCALGLRQLERLDQGLQHRRIIAARYQALCAKSGVAVQASDDAVRRHAWHLFVAQLPLEQLAVDRKTVFQELRAAGIPVNVHYIPAYWHPFYRRQFGYARGLCPAAERYYERAVTLPVSVHMSPADVDWIMDTLRASLESRIASV